MNKQLKTEIQQALMLESATTMEKATVKDLYSAIAKVVMQRVASNWEKCREKTKTEKSAYYFSAEFLIGRNITANLLNLDLLKDVSEILRENGLDINCFEDIDDPALGNGGLGRLAACFLESAASVDKPLHGFGIRYKYGLFKQHFEDGYQREQLDDWLNFGDPFSIRRESEAEEVEFKDGSVLAVPYDMPVIGANETVNTLRLWQSEAITEDAFSAFNNMKYDEVLKKKNRAEIISYLLYPNDETISGKLLRLRQQYFFCSASLKSLIRKYKISYGKDFTRFAALNAIHLNDTHPTLVIPELIRLLIKEGVSYSEAVNITQKSVAFTNHTIMGEALEKWDVTFLKKLIPGVLKIIERIQKQMEREEWANESHYIIKQGKVHMANLAVYLSSATNGVAEIHTRILKEDIFAHFYKVFPERFHNKTNGITPRRWLNLCNSELTNLIESRIGTSYKKDLSKLKELLPYSRDEAFMHEFEEVKFLKKRELSDYIVEHEGVLIPPHFIFDIQIKRLHEYKRQTLNALYILDYYYTLKESSDKSAFKPIAFIFGAKAAPGYYTAKGVIKFINEIGKLINADKEVADYIKVIFVHNYNVSYAEKLVTAADISEQISMAGMEASGTGNMKFMLNGTVTLGTMDGANVEIAEEAGRENNYIFGAEVEEVNAVKPIYKPNEIFESNPRLKRVISTLIDGTFSDTEGLLKRLYDSLLGHWEPDRFLVLHDFESYREVKNKLLGDYGSKEFVTKSIVNMACCGKFSSDRTILQYAKEVWKI